MDINNKAPLAAHKELFIQAAPAAVWQKLADIGSYSRWLSGADAVKLDGPVAPGSTFHLKGGSLTWHARLRVVEPERRIE
jgi:carbon monoxide dehydrogenase subunit G